MSDPLYGLTRTADGVLHLDLAAPPGPRAGEEEVEVPEVLEVYTDPDTAVAGAVNALCERMGWPPAL